MTFESKLFFKKKVQIIHLLNERSHGFQSSRGEDRSHGRSRFLPLMATQESQLFFLKRNHLLRKSFQYIKLW